ncbi:MAG: hydrolase [Planctomycetales bacterium]|nr:hydrolase [Planctomycetales bacterium]
MNDDPLIDAPRDRFVPRSPELLTADASLLLLVDLQERLLGVQPRAGEIVWNSRRLLDAASALGVRTAATEQYPEKLGATVPELRERLAEAPLTKLEFSAAGCDELWAALPDAGIDRVVVCGIESHVCVSQTVLDLLAAAYRVYVPVDAAGSRFASDHETALRRLEGAGAVLTTTEAVMFEWCQSAAAPAFKRISALAKETSP